MTTKIKRCERQMPSVHRQIKRRSKTDWPYNYDYDDKEFLKYFRSRTGIQVGLELKRTLSRFLLTNPKADEWLRTSKNFKYINPRKMVPFGEAREDVIRWHTILRKNLQHWWEIYQKENQPRKIRRRV